MSYSFFVRKVWVQTRDNDIYVFKMVFILFAEKKSQEKKARKQNRLKEETTSINKYILNIYFLILRNFE